MRFDDMLGTVMALPKTDAVSRQIVWRQLIDILAQSHRSQTNRTRQKALDWIIEVRPEIAASVRASVARSIAPRVSAADIVHYFAQDDPAIAAPVLGQAQLTVGEWREIIPLMPTRSRALLRERRDLAREVIDSLLAYGSADFALSSPSEPDVILPEPQADAEPPLSPIAEVVAKIEAFRARKAAESHASSVSEDEYGATSPPLSHFNYETDIAGVVTWVSAPSREALIGLSIATARVGWLSGVDESAAEAFRAQRNFRDAQLQVAGYGTVAGDWIMSGNAVFNPDKSVFKGFHGEARRARSAEHIVEPVSLSSQDRDSIRQLTHELRTPLNAIQGFAEMIESQMLGPVDNVYRMHAATIMHEGQRLIAAVEDVDLAARADAIAAPVTAGKTDACALLTLLSRELEPLTDRRHVQLCITRPIAAVFVTADAAGVQRLFAKLIGTIVGMAVPGERIDAVLTTGLADCELTVTRPEQLLALATSSLLSTDDVFTGEDADLPLLGLGFSLRLVAHLAQQMRMTLRIDPTRFSLIMPRVSDSALHVQTPSPHDSARAARPPSSQ